MTSEMITTQSDDVTATTVGSAFSKPLNFDSSVQKASRNSSSGEEDGLGNLVIDTDEDTDKFSVDKSRDSKPFYGFNSNAESKSPVRNNNNNNSVKKNFSNNKTNNNVEKEANKSVLPNNSGKLNSYSQATGFGPSGKIAKAKSKKSSKANKAHTPTSVGSSSSTSGTNSRISSPTASFMNSALDTDSKSNHNFDSKMLMPRASSSPDETNGKKIKSNKSKSHHKKHSKHSEKNSSSDISSGKTESMEKLKSKSKGSALPLVNTNASSTFSTIAGSHETLSRSSNVLSNSTSAEKINSSQHHSSTLKLNDVPALQSSSNIHKSNHNTFHSRVPARSALIAGTTGHGAKSGHACSYRDSSESAAPVSQNQHGRKKHKKTQSASSSIQHCSTARDNADSSQSRNSLYQQSSAGSGKRERSNGQSTTSGNESSKSKKIKLEQDGKDNNSRTPSTTVSLNSRSLNQLDNSDQGEMTERSRVESRSKNFETSAGNNLQNSGAKTPVPLVLAPSNHFATTLPRYNLSNPTDFASASGSSKTPLKQSPRGQFEQKEPTSMPQSKVSKCTVGTITCTADMGVMTEPDSLGPCEPGTSVRLDGIVWHETDTGVLVVNVTWRNRTYVGTLLDATKHDWAPPRFSDPDLDIELRGKNGRPKRSRGAQSENNRKGRSRGALPSNSDDIKSSPSAAAKRRNKNSESDVANNTDNDTATTPRSSSKRLRLTTSRGTKDSNQQPHNQESNAGSGSSSCSSPFSIECPHPNCYKQYSDADALKYHQSYAHCDSNEEKEDNKEKNKKEEKESSNEKSEFLLPNSSDSASQDPVPFVSETESLTTPKKSSDTKESYHSTETKINNAVMCDLSKEYEKNVSAFSKKSSQSSSKGISCSADNSPVPTIICPTDSAPPKQPHLPLREESTVFTSYPSSTPIPSSSAYSCFSNNEDASDVMKSHSVPSSVSNAADIEKEEAVQFLLKSQNADDSLFSGLSSYNQDSPHPTLSLGSRPSPAPSQQQQGHTPAYSSRLYQARYSAPKSSNEKKSLTSPITAPHPVLLPHYEPSLCTYRSSIPLSSDPPFSNSSTTSVATVHEKVSPSVSEESKISHKLANSPSFSKENYTVSVSGGNYLSSPKMAKGKTVPIPVDPTHSLQSTYAGSAVHGNSSLSKKIKRKKRVEEKNEEEGDSPKSKDTSFVTTQDSNIPYSNAGTPTSLSVGSHVGNFDSTSVQPLHSPLPRTHGDNVSVVNEPACGQTTDSNRRFLSQSNASANRKFPGIISPVSSSQTNNITVTGTFHPHPDPHKPQTAVSAQAQDRLRGLRPLSPSTPSSNKNNNNKVPGSHCSGMTRPSYPSLSKSRPSSGLGESAPSDKLCSDQETTSARPKTSEIKPHQEFSINQLQNQVESKIDNVYSKELANKPKPPHPTLTGECVRESPVPSQRPVERIVNLSEDLKQNPQKPSESRSGLEEVQKLSPSPRNKPMPDNQRSPYLPMINSHLVPLGGMGYLTPHLIDPNLSSSLAYMDPQSREQYERYMHFLQQQAFAQHSQQFDSKQHKATNEKDQNKQPLSQKDPPANWPQLPHSKRSTTPISPSSSHRIPNFNREKLSNPVFPTSGAPHSSTSQSGYRHVQTNPLSSQAPIRCHSVTPSNPSIDHSRPHHARSESLDRGKSIAREESSSLKKPPSPSVKSERSPDRVKESVRSSNDSQPSNIPTSVSYYSHPLLDRGGFQPYSRYLYGPQPVLPSQADWIRGQQHPPVSGKQSPPTKPIKERQSPTRYRISSKEDLKPKDLGSHFPPKEVRGKGSNFSSRKLTPSPDLKTEMTSSTGSKKSNPGPTGSSEIHTQMHHHTHHHIHGGVLIPPHYYPGPPVLGGPEAVSAYPVPYQKR